MSILDKILKRKTNKETVNFIANKKATKYIKKWLKEHNIRDLSIGNILYQVGFNNEIIKLIKEKNYKDNVVIYKIGDTEKIIEFTDYPEASIIIHRGNEYSFETYAFDKSNSNTKLIKRDELFHKIFDNGYELRSRNTNRKKYLHIKFIYSNNEDEIDFSTTSYNYNGTPIYNTKNNNDIEEYLKNNSYNTSIIDFYSEICKLYGIDTDSEEVTLINSGSVKNNFERTGLNIRKDRIYVHENGVYLSIDNYRGNIHIKISNDGTVIHINYEEIEPSKNLNYQKFEDMIRYFLNIKKCTASELYNDGLYKFVNGKNAKNIRISNQEYTTLDLGEGECIEIPKRNEEDYIVNFGYYDETLSINRNREVVRTIGISDTLDKDKVKSIGRKTK